MPGATSNVTGRIAEVYRRWRARRVNGAAAVSVGTATVRRRGGNGDRMVTVNVVVLAGTVAADPVDRTMPSGDEVTELRLSVPETGKRLLPLPVAGGHKTGGKRAVKGITKGDDVLVYGQLARRFYRSGAGARSLTEVVATGIKKLDPEEEEEGPR